MTCLFTLIIFLGNYLSGLFNMHLKMTDWNPSWQIGGKGDLKRLKKWTSNMERGCPTNLSEFKTLKCTNWWALLLRMNFNRINPFTEALIFQPRTSQTCSCSHPWTDYPRYPLHGAIFFFPPSGNSQSTDQYGSLH